MTDRTTAWLTQRPQLLSIAYSILGSWADAEDVVSQVWLKLQAEDSTIRNISAWLTVVTSRLALDLASSAARSRTDYLGPWLPDLVSVSGPEEQVVFNEQVNLAFIRLVQQLPPLDRSVLVLADVFQVPFEDIAKSAGITVVAARQRASRARKTLNAEGTPLSRTANAQELDILISAIRTGRLDELVAQLSEGCMLWTDSGGFSKAARRPIVGADKVVRFLAGILSKFGIPTLAVEYVVGGNAVRATSSDRVRMIVVEITDDRITGIAIQQNTEKLSRLSCD